MLAINPYLNFAGNTEEAFNFYKSIFGGDFLGGVYRFKDLPQMANIPDNEKEKVMHVALPVGQHSMLMATDSLESMGHTLQPGNNISLMITPDSKEDADRLFNALSEGGSVSVPMANAEWGDYFGMLTDKFGIKWMVNYSQQQQ